MAEVRATPIMVFIVLIYNKGVHMGVPTCKVGAVYWSEEAAQEECERLMKANSFSHASYTERQMDVPPYLQLSRPGQEKA
jgi:hypothetical protein